MRETLVPGHPARVAQLVVKNQQRLPAAAFDHYELSAVNVQGLFGRLDHIAHHTAAGVLHEIRPPRHRDAIEFGPAMGVARHWIDGKGSGSIFAAWERSNRNAN